MTVASSASLGRPVSDQKRILLMNGSLVDGSTDRPVPGINLLIDGGLVREVSERAISNVSDIVIDLNGRVIMPGLIDAHVHVVAGTANLADNAGLPDSLVTAQAVGILARMLRRGFTTVRDVGGADYGLVRAIELGLIKGPRLVICGKALSQTGGHTDFRGRFDGRDRTRFTHRLGSLGRLCDGIDEVRRACREEIKGGARFLKIMANGGVASPNDPIEALGFSLDEIRVVVEEARAANTYVAAHVYTDNAIRRCLELGVRSLEHCNLVQPDTARAIAASDAFVCPTLIVYDAVHRFGARSGIPAASLAKLEHVRHAGFQSLDILRAAGVRMTFGTDLLGLMHDDQSEEFVLRSRVLPNQEIIRSATSEAARLLNMEGIIGTLEPGGCADLVVVDGDPLRNIGLLTDQGQHMPVIIKDGRFVKNEL